MGRVIRELRVIVEPAGAAGLAVVLGDERFRGGRVGVLLSGGNTCVQRVRQALAVTAERADAESPRAWARVRV